MGFFDLFRKKKIRPEDKAVIENFKSSVDSMLSVPPQKPLTADEYKDIRQAERDWLESHYDFSTIESIEAIPEIKDLPTPPSKSPTGEVYYYLRYKAKVYEKSGEVPLAIACMKKSISLMQIRYGECYGREEFQSYIYMLIRNGYVEEAKIEQAKFDAHYANSLDRMRLQNFQAVCKQADELGTDLLLMRVNGSTCPECARYQGRVYSLSGKSKLFPALPETIKKTGTIHSGCHHSFSPYMHKVSRVDMNYTLQVHPLIDPRYGKDIVTFSNRPFVDDRTEESKEAAKIALENRRNKRLNRERRDEIILESYKKQQADYSDYEWLKEHFPDKCPNTATGYRRMKTQNTKNYQMLKQLAAKLGKEI